MEMRAYAKINLYLDVTGRRRDGYHDIVSIMQTVDLCDTVTVTCSKSEPHGIELRCDWDLPCDGRNLAYRAAQAYFGGDIPCAVHIDIRKSIPMQAGLAGGSADCAAVLLALNYEFGRYSTQGLIDLGATLGADVPFCLVGGTQVTRGIGEVMQPCAPMPDCYLVIARGGEGVSTPEAYRALDGMYGDFSAQKAGSEPRLDNVKKALQEKDLSCLANAMYNVFESVVLPGHDVARELKSDMLRGGAIGAMMSGSGPSIVGVFEHEDAAQNTCRMIREKGIVAHVCRPVN